MGLMAPSVVWAADSGQSVNDKPILVFAAASLKNAMDDVATAYDKSHPGPDVKISYAGSSTLARQIEAGAPADIYISANEQWMDKLAEDGRVDKDSRYDLLGNSLVLIAPRSSGEQIQLTKGIDLRNALGEGNYLAMANTDSVPAGIYGKQALQWLNVWSGIRDRIAQAADVRAALHMVDLGQAPLGVVYASDAAADGKNVQIVDTFPKASHKPIVYPVAAVADSDNAQDDEFLDFLKTDTAAKIFKHWGFRVLSSS